MLKNGKALDYETRKSGVSHKWFDELRRLIEWFLCTDSDGMVFGLVRVTWFVERLEISY